MKNTLVSSFLTLLATSSVVHADGTRNKVNTILEEYGPYVLSVNSKLSKRLPTDHHLSRNSPFVEGACSGFILEGAHNRVVTALHCLPDPIKLDPSIEDIEKSLNESAKSFFEGTAKPKPPKGEEIPFIITVNGEKAREVCRYPEADLAVLEVSGPITGKKAPNLGKNIPEVGSEYTSLLLNPRGFSWKIEGSNNTMYYPASIYNQGRVMSVVKGSEYNPKDDAISPTDVEVIMVNTPPKGGFSGGPLLSPEKVIMGVWSFVDGSFGVASSSANIHALLQKPECK